MYSHNKQMGKCRKYVNFFKNCVRHKTDEFVNFVPL